MATQNNSNSNSQSMVVEKDEFDYITLAEKDGMTRDLKFQVMNPDARPGDVLIVLEGSEVCFHGFIGRIADGWGFATDPGVSLLPAKTT